MKSYEGLPTNSANVPKLAKRKAKTVNHNLEATTMTTMNAPIASLSTVAIRFAVTLGGRLARANQHSLLTVLTLLAFSQIAQAVVPAPDGGYPGGNTAEGSSALLSLTSGTYNTAIGLSSLTKTLVGNFNTAIGGATLFNNTADSNTATGAGALLSNTIAFQNTATGAFALFSNTSGSNNTAVGAHALFSNTDGFRNNAVGILALSAHQTGNFNNAFGALALTADQIGTSNNALSDEALRSNTSGTDNTAMGDFALHDNTIGIRNTATGEGALQNNSTGGINTASGFQALVSSTTGIANTAIGYHALADNTSGSNNIALGAGAGVNVTTANNVYCIGTVGENVDDSCYIGGIFGQTSAGGTAVFINEDGKLGTSTSSRRFKDEIRPMERASEALFALKPVMFRYKKDLDPKGTPQFGPVAEDVEKISPDLVVRDENGKPYTVRYDAVNAMLLNEFLKEHRVVQQQAATIARLEKQIELLTAGLQNIMTQIELSKDARRTVLNER